MEDTKRGELAGYLKSQLSTSSLLEALPTAIGLWSSGRLFCVFNGSARKLLGFSERDFRGDIALWINQIDPQDRDVFRTAMKKIQTGEERIVQCDYRFYPKGSQKTIWLRDVSVSRRLLAGKTEGVISSYTDISDLRAQHSGVPKKESVDNLLEVIEAIVHEIQNSLHVIGMGLDLLYPDRDKALEDWAVITGQIGCVNNAIQELGEYLLPPPVHFAAENPAIVLEQVVQQMKSHLQRQGIRVQVVCQTPLPQVQLDLNQFRSALEGIVNFSRALLLDGGELEIAMGLCEIHDQRYVEIKIVSSSRTPLSVKESDAFRPFLRVNGEQVGLSLSLARQVLDRHEGKIFFRKENPQRGLFTVLLKVCQDYEGLRGIERKDA